MNRALRKAAVYCAAAVLVMLPPSTFAVQQSSTSTAGPAKQPALPAGVPEVLDQLANVPPELHADALLLLVESNLKLDRATKLKFIHEASELARQATVPVNLTRGVSALNIDSEAGRGLFASMRHLDQVSLLSRAFQDLASLDPSASFTMVAELRLPQVPPVECKEALVYEWKPYYTALLAVSRAKAGDSRQRKVSTVDLLTPAVTPMQTHTQVPPAMELLSGANISANDLLSLANTLAAQLGRLRDDPRSFAATMETFASSSFSQALALYQKLEATQPGAGLLLLKSLREYLTDNYRIGGCGQLGDTHTDCATSPTSLQLELPAGIVQFNNTFRQALEQTTIGNIRFDEIQTHVTVQDADIHEYWKEPDARALLRQVQLLRFNEQGERRNDSDRASTTWRTQAVTFLGHVDDWESDPMRSSEIFNEKCELYTSVIDLAPQPDVRWLAIEKNLSLLENSGLESQDAAGWMSQAWLLSGKAHTHWHDDGKPAEAPDAAFSKRLLNSPNPSLRLIGRLNQLGIDPFSTGQ